MDEQGLIEAHEYFLSQPQKMNKSLQAYKCNPTINKLFYNLSLTNEDVVILINELKTCYSFNINTGSDLIDLLKKMKTHYIDSFDLTLMDKSFTNKLKKEILVYRCGPKVTKFNGYTSTALDPKVTLGFYRGGNIFYNIILPKGCPYVYLESNKKDNSIVSNFKYEYEILLPRGAEFNFIKQETKKIRNPQYEYSKVDPFIDATYWYIKITGFKKESIQQGICFKL